MTDTPVRVADPALMRRAARKMAVRLIVVLVLTTFFTAGGISIVGHGDLAGLPFAIGGGLVQLALIILVGATLRVRRTLTGDTVSRTVMASGRRIAGFVRRTMFAAIVGLVLYAVIRVGYGDWGSLLTAVIISVALWAVAIGARRLRIAYDHTLSHSP